MILRDGVMFFFHARCAKVSEASGVAVPEAQQSKIADTAVEKSSVKVT